MESERLEFFTWEEGDKYFLLDHYSKDIILKYMQECRLDSIEQATETLRQYNKDYQENGVSLLKTIEKNSGNIVGVSGIFLIKVDAKGSRIDDKKEGNIELELGYDFNPNYWGKGKNILDYFS